MKLRKRLRYPGDLFDAQTKHFGDELDEVDLHAATPTALDVAWRRERATVELRAGFLECERLGAERAAIVLGPLDDALSERLAAEPKLRERLIVYDLAALSKAEQRGRVPRVVPARRLRRQGARLGGLHAGPRLARCDLARHGLAPPGLLGSADPEVVSERVAQAAVGPIVAFGRLLG